MVEPVAVTDPRRQHGIGQTLIERVVTEALHRGYEYLNLYTVGTREVYHQCMSRTRTNIEIDDQYVEAIMDRFGVHTKTEAVDLALRHLAGQPMTREEALAMRGSHAIGEIPTDNVPRTAK